MGEKPVCVGEIVVEEPVCVGELWGRKPCV